MPGSKTTNAPAEDATRHESDKAAWVYIPDTQIEPPTRTDLLRVAYARAMDDDERGDIRIKACDFCAKQLDTSAEIETKARAAADEMAARWRAEMERSTARWWYRYFDARLWTRDLYIDAIREGMEYADAWRMVQDQRRTLPDGVRELTAAEDDELWVECQQTVEVIDADQAHPDEWEDD